MITIKLSWWLWNQMFQYAYWYSLAKKYNTKLVLDKTFLTNKNIKLKCTKWPYELDIFNISDKLSFFSQLSEKFEFLNYINTKIFQMFNYLIYNKNYILDNYWELIFDIKNNSYLNWYWFSHKYFSEYSEDIIKIFEVKKDISEKNKNYIEIINKNYLNTVSVHIRRWDYIISNSKSWKGLWDTHYYEESLKYIKNKIRNPLFIVLSDDIEWVKENINFWENVIFIDWNEKAWYEDLRIMYSCANHIIANSTFSWWGAYLWKNKNKIVIAPKQWFFVTNNYNQSNYLPENWIKI